MAKSDEPISIAKAALNDSVSQLLATDAFDDLDWLPPDFVDQLTEMAWAHRADRDGGRFKRALRNYVREIAPERS